MRRSRKLLVGAGVGIMALVIASTAWAVVTSFDSTGIQHIVVVTKTTSFSTNSLAYVTIPNASATVFVPTNGMVRARFSGESTCGGETNTAGICSMRINTTGAVLNPKSGLDFAFDSFPPNACCLDTTPEAHSMEWVSDPLTQGSYTFTARIAVTNSNVSFVVDDWTFSVEVLTPVPS